MSDIFTEDWKRRTVNLVQKFEGVLKMELGFQGCMSEVFFYLWEKRLYKNSDGSSSHEVFKGVRAIHLSKFIGLDHVIATEKNVDQALSDLYEKGFINKLKPTKTHRGEGRPPKSIFRAKRAPEIMRALEASFDARKRALYVGVFSHLEEYEAVGNTQEEKDHNAT